MGSAGPGPRYSLPPTIGFDKHDQRKFRSPQYTMAGRLNPRNVKITPGPNINTQGLTRYGRAISHAYTTAPRIFGKDWKKIGPGPANYDLTYGTYKTKPAPPSYTLGRINNFNFKKLIPGPNAYAINNIILKKSAPAFSLGLKTEVGNKTNSPGPANYSASNLKTTMCKTPEYSIYPRTKDIYKSFVPGSNNYDRTSYKPGKSPPSYSFGVRHSPKAPPMIVPCDKV